MHPLAYRLGFSGLAPFFFYGAQHAPPSSKKPWGDSYLIRAGLGALAARDQATVRRRFSTYSLSILSFLGAVHMGSALTQSPSTLKTRAMLAWSVCPSLIAWGAVNLPEDNPAVPPRAAYMVLSAGFLAALVADRAAGLPAWYLRMRVPLTALVLGSHAVAIALPCVNV